MTEGPSNARALEILMQLSVPQAPANPATRLLGYRALSTVMRPAGSE